VSDLLSDKAKVIVDGVFRTAVALVAAFGAHDVEQYFASFAHDASFLFYNRDDLIESRAEYQQVWQGWENEGFRVLRCRSLEPRVQLISNEAAVFTHRVRTLLDGEAEELRERETIIFHKQQDGRWLGVHEHLSIDPQESVG
jgi:ketosteroid isomerase-like protein